MSTKTNATKAPKKHIEGQDGLFTAKVRPEDLAVIKHVANQQRVDPPIIAGVLADIGESLIRPLPYGNHRDPSEILLGVSTSQALWRVINRSAALFKRECLAHICLDNDQLDTARSDAEQMGRELGDWVGSLIMLGAEAVTSGKPLTCLVAGHEMRLLTEASRYHFEGRKGEVIA